MQYMAIYMAIYIWPYMWYANSLILLTVTNRLLVIQVALQFLLYGPFSVADQVISVIARRQLLAFGGGAGPTTRRSVRRAHAGRT